MNAKQRIIPMIVIVFIIGISGCTLGNVSTPTITPTITLTPTTGMGSRMISEKDGMTIVFVPAGSFTMGAEIGSVGGRFDNYPPHSVYLSNYWIDLTEVTQGMFSKCVTAGICDRPVRNHGGDNYPVIGVDRIEANIYCQWAGRRLPTEAEWEKAARGTDGRIYPWGNQRPTSLLANYDNNHGGTTAVGSLPNGASPYGILDMSGNVGEWVFDIYDYPYNTTNIVNPTGPTPTGGSDNYVFRGGDWQAGNHIMQLEYVLMATVRTSAPDVYRDDTIGFRCAQS